MATESTATEYESSYTPLLAVGADIEGPPPTLVPDAPPPPPPPTTTHSKPAFTRTVYDVFKVACSEEGFNDPRAAGLDINLISDDGSNALHLAVRELNVEAVRNLLDAGINVNTVNNAGESPFFVACNTINREDLISVDPLDVILSLLLSYGASVIPSSSSCPFPYEVLCTDDFPLAQEIKSATLGAAVDPRIIPSLGAYFECDGNHSDGRPRESLSVIHVGPSSLRKYIENLSAAMAASDSLTVGSVEEVPSTPPAADPAGATDEPDTDASPATSRRRSDGSLVSPKGPPPRTGTAPTKASLEAGEHAKILASLVPKRRRVRSGERVHTRVHTTSVVYEDCQDESVLQDALKVKVAEERAQGSDRVVFFTHVHGSLRERSVLQAVDGVRAPADLKIGQIVLVHRPEEALYRFELAELTRLLNAADVVLLLGPGLVPLYQHLFRVPLITAVPHGFTAVGHATAQEATDAAIGGSCMSGTPKPTEMVNNIEGSAPEKKNVSGEGKNDEEPGGRSEDDSGRGGVCAETVKGVSALKEGPDERGSDDPGKENSESGEGRIFVVGSFTAWGDLRRLEDVFYLNQRLRMPLPYFVRMESMVQDEPALADVLRESLKANNEPSSVDTQHPATLLPPCPRFLTIAGGFFDPAFGMEEAVSIAHQPATWVLSNDELRSLLKTLPDNTTLDSMKELLYAKADGRMILRGSVREKERRKVLVGEELDPHTDGRFAHWERHMINFNIQMFREVLGDARYDAVVSHKLLPDPAEAVASVAPQLTHPIDPVSYCSWMPSLPAVRPLTVSARHAENPSRAGTRTPFSPFVPYTPALHASTPPVPPKTPGIAAAVERARSARTGTAKSGMSTSSVGAARPSLRAPATAGAPGHRASTQVRWWQDDNVENRLSSSGGAGGASYPARRIDGRQASVRPKTSPALCQDEAIVLRLRADGSEEITTKHASQVPVEGFDYTAPVPGSDASDLPASIKEIARQWDLHDPSHVRKFLSVCGKTEYSGAIHAAAGPALPVLLDSPSSRDMCTFEGLQALCVGATPAGTPDYAACAQAIVQLTTLAPQQYLAECVNNNMRIARNLSIENVGQACWMLIYLLGKLSESES
eukprot:Rmarinus@m.1435